MNDSRTFQVDLRGIVDLLSHHLYGSPRVYVRELLQNAVDAITARRVEEPDAPGEVRFEPAEATGDGTLRVHDTGIGLSEAQVHELLATIGRTSKRDDFGFARHEFLGQFGIGLLSCFLVADEIRVLTRAAGCATVSWVGQGDGRYSVTLPEEQRAEVGTTVILVPRHGHEHWLGTTTVVDLASLYGSMLPVTVTVATAPTPTDPRGPLDTHSPTDPRGPLDAHGPADSDGASDAHAPSGGMVTTVGTPPWLAHDRRLALTAHARTTLGFDPFDVIDLSVPEAGLRGAAFVLPHPTNPAGRVGHRIYLKRMLLAESAEGLLPEWAFFARCVVDATELRPTASREALYEDSLLESTRDALGDQLRGWLVRLSATNPTRLADFLAIHHLGVKALALHDDEMLRMVDRWWPYETNIGRMTLADFRDRYGILRYSATTDQFRQLAAVAAAQDVPLINAGYTYESDIIERLAAVEPDVQAERLEPGDLATRFEALDLGDEMRCRPFLISAQRAMDRVGCEVIMRSFDPAGMPAMYLIDREAAFRGELRATKDKADPVWADVLAALDSAARDVRPQLVLNYRSSLVRRMTGLVDPDVIALAVEALYGQALLLGYHPIRPADAALLNRSFLGLLDRAVPGEA